MNSHFVPNRVVVRGAGEMATGVIRRLIMAGFEVFALEKPAPTCVRRFVCYAEAVFEGKASVDGLEAVLASSVEEAVALAATRCIPLLIDPEAACLPVLAPMAVVDARMLKGADDADPEAAPIVIGLGPGFVAGVNCLAVVETNRGIDLGRVVYSGSSGADTGIPGAVNGYGHQRVLRAPADGTFIAKCSITDRVKAGQIIGHVDGVPVPSTIDGIVRGLIRDGLSVSRGLKIGDVDPRGIEKYCFLVSDKANAVGGGVLEALMALKANIAHSGTTKDISVGR